MSKNKNSIQKNDKPKARQKRKPMKPEQASMNKASSQEPKSTSLNLGGNKFKKFKKKSKMKPKKSQNNEDEGKKEVEQEAKSLSSNWKAFLKETNVQKKQTDFAMKEKKSVQKRRMPATNQKKPNKKRKTVESEIKMQETDTLKESDIWFDDVDIEDIENAVGKKLRCDNEKIEKVDGENAVINGKNGQMHMGSITKRLGIDCEMVGVGIDGKESMLARVSIVNSFGDTVYDSFVAPMQKVVDYRTEFSGVRPVNLINARTFQEVQKDVANLTDGKILVGHAIHNDLKVLLLSHSKKHIRDTSTYKPFKKLLKTRYPSLKKLTKEVLNIDIQSGEHSSVEDAKCAMKIYLLHRRNWEKDLKVKGHRKVVAKTPKIFMGKQSKEDRMQYVKRKIERQKSKRKLRRSKQGEEG